jgi:tetratricopeptide (TPR) repeat protein
VRAAWQVAAQEKRSKARDPNTAAEERLVLLNKAATIFDKVSSTQAEQASIADVFSEMLAMMPDGGTGAPVEQQHSDAIASNGLDLARRHLVEGRHSEALKVLERCESLHTGQVVLAEILVVKAQALQESNNQDNLALSLEMLQRALKMRLDLGDSPHLIAAVYTQLGLAYRDLGQLPEALDSYKHALRRQLTMISEASTRHSDPSSPVRRERSLAAQLTSFGGTARALLQVEIDADGHPTTLHSSGSSAALPALGDVERSRTMTITDAEDLANVKHLSDTYNNIGEILDELGQHAEALGMFERSATMTVMTHGPAHHFLSVCYNNMARAHGTLGNHQNAISFYEQAYDLVVARDGDAHKDLAPICAGKAFAHQALNQFEEALRLFQKTVAIETASYGGRHEDVALSTYNLASCLERMGRKAEAKEAYLSSADVYKQCGDDEAFRGALKAAAECE